MTFGSATARAMLGAHPAAALSIGLVLSVALPGALGAPGAAGVPVSAEKTAAPPAAPSHLKVPAGFTIEIAAGPDVTEHPMMLAVGEHGSLFIAESSGVNLTAPELLAKPPHKMLMLTDSDGDGRYDRKTVFADGLAEPNGALWYRGALYVCSAPYLWRFEDTDRDGRADRRERIVGKFNFNGMSDSMHGPVLGPDGRLYWCGGQHGWQLYQVTADRRRSAPDPASERETYRNEMLVGDWTSMAPGLFSCWPDGSAPEAIGFGGVCNPVEATFTPAGEALGTVSVFDMFDGRHDALLHWIEGGVYNLNERSYVYVKTTGDVLTPMSRRGHNAPSGVHRYEGSQFGPAYRDSLFLCEFNTHKVYRVAVARDGATFRSTEEVFLESTSTDSHFTDVAEEGDGSLLVVDTGGWFLRGCPTSQIAKPQLLGSIYRIRKTGANAVSDPYGLRVDWPRLSPDRMAALLDDERPAVREAAIEHCALGGEAVLAPLTRMLQSTSPRARLGAVWTLCRMGKPAALDANRRALADRALEVRLAAIHTAGLHRDRAAREALCGLVATNESLAVRRAGATALGRLKDAEAVPPLLKALADAQDRFLEHALIFALIRIDDRAQTAAALATQRPRFQRAVLIALDRMEHGALRQSEVLPLATSGDEALERTALDVMVGHGWASEVAGIAERWLARSVPSAARQAMLRSALLALRSHQEVQATTAKLLSAQDTPQESKLLVLDVIAHSEFKAMPSGWEKPVLALLSDKNSRMVAEAVTTLAAFGAGKHEAELIAAARRADLPDRVRITAASTVSLDGGTLPDDVVALLGARLSSEAEPSLRLAAARALGAAHLADGQLGEVVKLVRTAGPLELGSLLGTFEQSSPTRGKELIAALKAAPGLPSIPAGRLRRLFERYPAEVRTAADELLRSSSGDYRSQVKQLETLLPEVVGGDVQRGKAVFFASKGTCSACHRVGDRGDNIGPNLSAIGEIRTRRDLLEAIVFPSASFARGFEPLHVETNDGKVYSGTVSRENADSLYLRLSDRSEVRIARDEIEDLAPSKVSIMPQGLDKTLKTEELRDLLAYLTSLKAGAAAMPKQAGLR